MFLKAERDATQKSAMIRRPYPPGQHTKRSGRRGSGSEFGIALKEKQKLRYLYGVSDRALKGYVAQASRARQIAKTAALIELLERRIDSAVWRIGLVPSRRMGRQAVSHGHVLINGKRVRTPSRLVRIGDVLEIHPQSRGKGMFAGAEKRLAKYEPPAWLSLEPEAWRGSVRTVPTAHDDSISFDTSRVIEFYSR